MVSKSALVAVVLVAVTNAVPIASPLQMMARAGPEAGKVRQSGMLDLIRNSSN